MGKWKGFFRKQENCNTEESWKEKGFRYDVWKFSGREWLRYGGEGIGLLLGMSWLFYHSIGISMLSVVFLPVYLRYRKGGLIKKRRTQLNYEFREGVRSLAGALRAGYSVENAWREAVCELALCLGRNALIVREFEYIARGIEVNQPIEQLLAEFGERSGSEDIQSFALIFRTGKRTGGNFIGMMERTAGIITEKQEVSQEIEAILAAKKLEHRIMSIIPAGIILYTQFSFPGFTDVLYGNMTGVIVMTICLGVYGAAFYLGGKITEVEI